MSADKANVPTKSDKIIAELKNTEKTYSDNIKFLDKFFMLSPPEEDKEKAANVVEDKEKAAEKAAKLEKHIKAVEKFKKTPEGKEFIAELEKIRSIQKLSEDITLKLNASSVDSSRIGHIFSEELNFNAYNQYLESQSRISVLCTSLQEKNKKFKNLMEEFTLDNRGTNLASVLIMPVQRLPRYKLLLTELQKTEGEGTEAFSILGDSVLKVGIAATVANEAVRRQEDLTKLAEWTDVLTNHGYSAPENRALRSVRKPGDISGSFNTDTDLEALKEALEKNEAFGKIFNTQQITFAYAQKEPLIIHCMLGDKPLCKIVQKTGKDGEKTFYVRIKTDLSTLKNGESLDHDAITEQLAMAQEVSNVVAHMVENQSVLKPGLQARLLAAEGKLKHDPNFDNNPKVTPLALPTLHDKIRVTTAKDQTTEAFSTYYECLMKQLGSSVVSQSLSENSGAIAVTSASKMLANSKPVGTTGYLITVTHSPDNSIHTDFPSVSDEWKKVFSNVLKANIEAGLTSLSPSGSFEQIKYMTKEILKENLTPVFSPETSKLLEKHKDGGDAVEFLQKVRDEIEAEKSPGKSSHIISKL